MGAVEVPEVKDMSVKQKILENLYVQWLGGRKQPAGDSRRLKIAGEKPTRLPTTAVCLVCLDN